MKSLFIPLFLLTLTFWTLSETQDVPEIDRRADAFVDNYYRTVFAQELASSHQFLSQEERTALVTARLEQFKKTKAYRNNASQVSEQVKQWYKDDHNQTYFYTPDSFYWYRLARNLRDHGHLGTELYDHPFKNVPYRGEVFDALRNAPDGDFPQPSLLPYVLFYFYKLSRFLIPAVSLETTTFYFPVFIGMLSVILLFFLGKRIGGVVLGFFAAFLLALHPLFIQFTSAGSPDTNTLAFFFSTLVMTSAFFVLTVKKWSRTFLALVIFFFSFYLLRITWSGWYFFFVIFFFTSGWFLTRTLLCNYVHNNHKLSGIALLFLLFFILYIFALFTTTSAFTNILFRFGLSQSATIYPAPFSSIQELQPLSLSGLPNLFGGWLLFAFAAQVLFVLVKKPSRTDTLLVFWAVLTFIPGMLAIRFLYFFLPPFVLLTASFLTRMLRAIPLSKHLSASIFIIILLFLFPNATPTLPFTYDSFHVAGRWLATNTLPNSLVVTWWSHGYAWQAASQRPTLFDGGLFTTPYTYWTSVLLTTNDTLLAQGLLQTIACEQHQYLFDIDTRSPEHTKRFVRANLSEIYTDRSLQHEVFDIVNATHCQHPRDTYVAIAADMLYKYRSYDSFSAWSFNGTPAQSFIRPISAQSTCVRANAAIACDNGFTVVNLDARKAGLHPHSLVRIENGTRTQTLYNDAAGNFTIVLFNTDGQQWRALLMEPRIANSLLVRMYTGEHLFHFKKVFESKEEPERVVIYQVIFRNETLPTPTTAMPLAPLSASYYYTDLLINHSRYMPKLLFLALRHCAPVNLTAVYHLGRYKDSFISLSRHANCTVPEYEQAINSTIEDLLLPTTLLSTFPEFYYLHVRNMTPPVILLALQHFAHYNISESLLYYNNVIERLFYNATASSTITYGEFLDELHRIITADASPSSPKVSQQ